MTLYYIVNARLPTEKAHGYQIMKMCEMFAKQKINVVLIVPDRKKNPLQEDPFVYYNINHNFQLIKIPVIDLLWLPNPAPFLSYPFLLASFVFGVCCFLRKNWQPEDLIYTRDFEILCACKKYPQINYEVHTLTRTSLFFKNKWRHACHIIVLTNALRELLSINLNIPDNKILIAADAVNLDDFANLPDQATVREQLKLPKNEWLIGYVGKFQTMNLSKGVDTLLTAISLIPNPKVIGILVGGLPAEISTYQQKIKNLKMENRIIIIPLQPRECVPLYLKAMDILVVPSPKLPFYQYYSSPLKLFEYMASGVPIIASDLQALREILNEQNAVLVPPDDPLSLAKMIKYLLLERKKRRILAARAQKDVMQYTWDNRARSILHHISERN